MCLLVYRAPTKSCRLRDRRSTAQRSVRTVRYFQEGFDFVVYPFEPYREVMQIQWSTNYSVNVLCDVSIVFDVIITSMTTLHLRTQIFNLNIQTFNMREMIY